MDEGAMEQLVSERLLAIPEVAGMSLSRGALTVYCKEDSDSVRAEVRVALDAIDFEGAVAFEVTGPFRLL